MMKIAALGGALAFAMTTASFAQTTGPAGQQDTNKVGTANPNSMSADGMKKQSSTTGSATTGSAMTGKTTPGSDTGPSGNKPKPTTN